jgi:AraC family transcriptional regulator
MRPTQVGFLPSDHSLRGYIESVEHFKNAHLLVKPDWVARASDGEIDLPRLELRSFFGVRNPLIAQAMLGLVREVEQPGPMGRIYTESLTLGIVTELLRCHAALPKSLPQSNGMTARRFQRVTEFIEANLDQDLSLASLAAEACLSRAQFVRQFKRLTGLSSHQYVLRRRVDRAAALLKSGELCLKGLALEVGFSSQSHLTEAFRRVYGTTPGAYRDQHAPAV